MSGRGPSDPQSSKALWVAAAIGAVAGLVVAASFGLLDPRSEPIGVPQPDAPPIQPQPRVFETNPNPSAGGPGEGADFENISRDDGELFQMFRNATTSGQRLQVLNLAARRPLGTRGFLIRMAAASGDHEAFDVALELASDFPAGEYIDLLDEMAGSPDAYVANVAVSALSTEARKEAVPPIIRALGHPDSDVREEARDALIFWTDQTFQNTLEAEVWWNQHAADFDEELEPVAAEAPPPPSGDRGGRNP